MLDRIEGTTPMASPPIGSPSEGRDLAERLAIQTFARLDKTALGIAVGATCALGLFLATVILVLRGGHPVGPTLGLLAQFFPGYSVTPVGSVVGAGYAFAVGFGLGWLAAGLRNFILAVHLRLIRTSAELTAVQSFLDDM